jgi:hypothetical protein
LFVSLVETLRSLDTLPDEELATTLARQYQEEVARYQQRMHLPPAAPPTIGSTLPLLPTPSPTLSPPTPLGPAAGWRAFHAILDPVREEICQNYRSRPDQFERPETAVPTVLRSLTRVEPPPPFLLTAAYLLWRRGLPGFCGQGTPSSEVDG